MSKPIEESTSIFYCNSAMSLCQLAMNLYSQGKYKEGAAICKFVASLCAKKPLKACVSESKLCYLAATLFEAENIEEGTKYCNKARALCPRNFRVVGD